MFRVVLLVVVVNLHKKARYLVTEMWKGEGARALIGWAGRM